MKFGEMLDWALRLRALGALRAWVGARGPTGGSRAMRCVARDFWRVDGQYIPRRKLFGGAMLARFTKMGDYPLDAGLGPGSAIEGDCRR